MALATSPAVDVPKTFGALLLGGLLASLLSGFVVVQVVAYFRLYPRDTRNIKVLVLSVWVLDTCHTAFIWAALWSYIIGDYGEMADIDIIHWNIAAILTFLVHIRIILLSKRNYYITAPIILLACLRLDSLYLSLSMIKLLPIFNDLVSASVTTAEINILKIQGRNTCLALSTAVDVLITVSLFVLLQSSRADAPSLTAVIDSLIRYAFETGSLTCAGTVISMICHAGPRSRLLAICYTLAVNARESDISWFAFCNWKALCQLLAGDETHLMLPEIQAK
ncbi:hypothetical protein HYPSUDRAFT_56718 [Hypholoma sublateritium FD-334 SS-4]|uniref:DUF6534 domain-containing protein n=1 Tax=Hypholoma sublateritium (strain FD-334 SS-4) TaxID=945553 RepID=A0A0D2M7J0_HYPSF|nr:hypothetical protein HYPSUDRAFT_56718 [Hypholoma sublateritium FD-334 SS-4]